MALSVYFMSITGLSMNSRGVSVGTTVYAGTFALLKWSMTWEKENSHTHTHRER